MKKLGMTIRVTASKVSKYGPEITPYLDTFRVVEEFLDQKQDDFLKTVIHYLKDYNNTYLIICTH